MLPRVEIVQVFVVEVVFMSEIVQVDVVGVVFLSEIVQFCPGSCLVVCVKIFVSVCPVHHVSARSSHQRRSLVVARPSLQCTFDVFFLFAAISVPPPFTRPSIPCPPPLRTVFSAVLGGFLSRNGG